MSGAAISASRGAVRTPLPKRSEKRSNSTAGQFAVSASNGLAAFEIV